MASTQRTSPYRGIASRRSGRGAVRRLLAIALGAAVLLATAGCSWLVPDPPDDVVAKAEAYAAQIRDLPGVDSAEARVTAVDPKDKPNEWRTAVRVIATGADDLPLLPGAVSAIRAPSGLISRVTIDFPAAQGIAALTLGSFDSAAVQRAGVLRALSAVRSVAVTEWGSGVTVGAGTSLTEAAALIRGTGTLTTDPFDAVHVGHESGKGNAEISQAGPSDPLLRFIDKLVADPAVRFADSAEPSEQSARPLVRVGAADPDSVAAALAGLAGDEREGRPRTAFGVSDEDAPIRGFVGLPLDSPEPDDLVPPPVPPTPDEEAARAAALAEYELQVGAFLDDAAEAAGIPTTPEVFVTDCETPATGSRVQGMLLIDVFAQADSADPAYDAITSAWEKKGYTHSDQALGTAVYAPITSQPVAQATIRGTSDGIRISAFSPCVG